MLHRFAEVVNRPSETLGAAEWRSIARALGFSNRELEIAQAIFDGAQETEIGTMLRVSKHTVHSHIRRMYDKTHAGNRSELLVQVFLVHLAHAGHSRQQAAEAPSLARSVV